MENYNLPRYDTNWPSNVVTPEAVIQQLMKGRTIDQLSRREKGIVQVLKYLKTTREYYVNEYNDFVDNYPQYTLYMERTKFQVKTVHSLYNDVVFDAVNGKDFVPESLKCGSYEQLFLTIKDYSVPDISFRSNIFEPYFTKVERAAAEDYYNTFYKVELFYQWKKRCATESDTIKNWL